MKSIHILLVPFLVYSGCAKKNENVATANIATEVVSNLSAISSSYAPASLSSATTRSMSKADPCQGVSDFAVCQSNLIREYMKIAKETVDSLATLANSVGSALGSVPDSNSGTSANGKISWNKTSSSVWSILSRGTNNNSLAYFSINNGVYTLKMDGNQSETEPVNHQIEATVTYNSATDWTINVFFGNGVCDSTEVGKPSKAHLIISKSGALWTGKAMLYVPRWNAPGSTAMTCSDAAGVSEVTMYTDFVGNDASSKAALYLIPTNENTSGIPSIASYDLPDFCTNFGTACGGAGQPTSGAMAAYQNNWCSTGPNTTPTWGNNCTANTAVSAASYSNPSLWTTPAALKTKAVSLPTSL